MDCSTDTTKLHHPVPSSFHSWTRYLPHIALQRMDRPYKEGTLSRLSVLLVQVCDPYHSFHPYQSFPEPWQLLALSTLCFIYDSPADPQANQPSSASSSSPPSSPTLSPSPFLPPPHHTTSPSAANPNSARSSTLSLRLPPSRPSLASCAGIYAPPSPAWYLP